MTRAPIPPEIWDMYRDERAAPMCGFPFPHRSMAELPRDDNGEWSIQFQSAAVPSRSGGAGSHPAPAQRCVLPASLGAPFMVRT